MPPAAHNARDTYGGPHSGSQCFVLPHEAVLGVDMPGAETERREFDIVLHGHGGEKLYELNQVDMRDLPAWGDYMVRAAHPMSSRTAALACGKTQRTRKRVLQITAQLCGYCTSQMVNLICAS